MNKNAFVVLFLLIVFAGCTEDGVGEAFKPLSVKKDFVPKEPACVPSIEVCDGIDNDCDNKIDEENACVEEEKEVVGWENQFIWKDDSGILNILEEKELPNHVPGQLIIKFKIESGITTDSQASSYLQSSKAKAASTASNIQEVERVIKKNIVADNYGLNRIFLIKVDLSADILEWTEQYTSDPNIEYAEPNYLSNTFFTPNDPRFGEQWAHQNTQAELGWDLEIGDPEIIIAILDTGVDYTHEDLAENIWINEDEDCDESTDLDGNDIFGDCRGYDFVGGIPLEDCHELEDCELEDNDPMDFQGHGTHCAGISAAVTDNSIGIAGACPNCKIMAVRAGWSDPIGRGQLMTEDIIQGIYYATENQADIISMSFGGPESQAQKDVIDYAYSNGVVLVAAAGNEGSSWKSYPAAYDNVIAVAATDYEDYRAGFSQYGSWVDVAVPGVDILSALPNNNYDLKSGTSMATPYVAGLAGLILSKNSVFTNEEVKNLLRTGVDIPLNADRYIGTGRINSYKALQIDSIPIANLDFSLDDILFSGAGTIDINGTAGGNNFSNYTLEYGKGIYPTDWTLVQEGNVPVTNSALGVFDTMSVIDGDYSLRLTSRDSFGNESIDKALITINNNSITSSLGKIHRAGEIIEIKATVLVNADSYSVEYSSESDPFSWSNNGVILTGVAFPASDITIASWDTSFITEPDYYKIRVNIDMGQGVVGIMFIDNLYFDPNLKEGWPKRFKLVDHYETVNMLPVISDIDNDGFQDIVFIVGPNKVFAYKYDGTSLPGFPAETPFIPEEKTFFGDNLPVVGDLEGDGFEEIIFRGNSAVLDDKGNYVSIGVIYAYDYQGNPVPGWPVFGDFRQNNSPIILDLNNDGYSEIIVKGSKNTVVYDRNGNLLLEISTPENNGGLKNPGDQEHPCYGYMRCIIPNSSPAIGNFDDDAELEIIVIGTVNFQEGPIASATTTIYVFNLNGSFVENWPVDIVASVMSSPAIGDIDNDGEDEIIFGALRAGESVVGNRGLYVFDRNGSIATGWPQLTSFDVWSSPALGDLDEDGDLEIVVEADNNIYVFNHDGSVKTSWSLNEYPFTASAMSPIIADIDNDGKLDILSRVGERILAWNSNGVLINGFPKILLWENMPPEVEDIDNEGKLELISSSGADYDLEDGLYNTMYVWDLDDSAANKLEWPQFHHDAQHTGLYKKSTECIKLTQNDFDNSNGDFIINYSSGCVEIVEDIKFNDNIIVENGEEGFYLTCNDHTIFPDPPNQIKPYKIGFKVYDHVSVTNCKVYNARAGFEIRDYSKVFNSEADLVKDGFVMYEEALLANSKASNCTGIGLEAQGQNQIWDSEARNCFIGSLISANSKGFNITAYDSSSIGVNIRLNGVCTNCKSYNSSNTGININDTGICKVCTSNRNQTGVVVGSNSQLLDGEMVCYNQYSDISVQGGTVSGTFQSSSPIYGYGDWTNANIIPCFTCGDIDQDGTISPTDVVYLINYVYKNLEDPEACYEPCGDINDDGTVNPVDVVHMINWVYKNLVPECPCGVCGENINTPIAPKETDPNLDELIEEYPKLGEELEKTKITEPINKEN